LWISFHFEASTTLGYSGSTIIKKQYDV